MGYSVFLLGTSIVAITASGLGFSFEAKSSHVCTAVTVIITFISRFLLFFSLKV